MTSEHRLASERDRKRRDRRRARGLPEDLLVIPKVSPEEQKRRKAELARRKYRRLRGLPEDAVLRPTPEQSSEKRLATKRKNEHKRTGSVPRAEYLAKLAAKRAEKEREKEAAKLAKIRERLIREARKAEEREARKCQTSTKYGSGRTQKSVSSSPAVTVRKPGRLVAMCGWNGW